MSVAFLNDQFWFPFSTRPYGRFLRAELLRQMGRDQEALAWYGNFAVAWGTEYVYHAPRFLRMAQIHESRGEREEAVEYYRRFVSWWEEADPEYQPLMEQARERIEALSNELPSTSEGP